MPQGFDIDGARKSGATDDQIIQYLTRTRSFDTEGALKSGATKAQIIQYLSATGAKATPATPQVPVNEHGREMRPGSPAELREKLLANKITPQQATAESRKAQTPATPYVPPSHNLKPASSVGQGAVNVLASVSPIGMEGFRVPPVIDAFLPIAPQDPNNPRGVIESLRVPPVVDMLNPLPTRPGNVLPNLEDARVPPVAKPFYTGFQLLNPFADIPSDEDINRSTEDLTSFVVGAKAPSVAGKAANKLPPNVREAVASNLERRAAANVERVLGPKTLETQAAARKIAPELAANQQLKGLRQSTIDRSVMDNLERSGTAVRAAEDVFVRDARPEAQLSRNAVLEYIDSELAKLKVKKTDVTIRGKAESALDGVRAKVQNMPEFMDPETIIDLRRNLDDAVDEMGGFRDAPPELKMDVAAHRGVSDFIRHEINKYDPVLSKANHDYWLNRKASEIVGRRQLGDVGKSGSGLPGRGSLLDDVLAASAGAAIGGPMGAVIAEGANLARQTPGFALQKAKTQQFIADAIRRGTPAPYSPSALATELIRPKQPRMRLLEPGTPVLPRPKLDPSGVTAIEAEFTPTTRAQRLGLMIPERTGARTMPAPETSAVTGIQAESILGTRQDRLGLLIPERAGARPLGRTDQSAIRAIDAEFPVPESVRGNVLGLRSPQGTLGSLESGAIVPEGFINQLGQETTAGRTMAQPSGFLGELASPRESPQMPRATRPTTGSLEPLERQRPSKSKFLDQLEGKQTPDVSPEYMSPEYLKRLLTGLQELLGENQPLTIKKPKTGKKK